MTTGNEVSPSKKRQHLGTERDEIGEEMETDS